VELLFTWKPAPETSNLTNSMSQRPLRRRPGSLNNLMTFHRNIPAVADTWYFAYGSNLHVAANDPRAALIRAAQPAYVSAMRLTFNRVGGQEIFSNMVFDPTAVVWGVAYLCDSIAMAKFDRARGSIAPRCRPISVRLETPAGQTLDAKTYVAGKKFITKQWRPKPDYLSLILKGAQNHGLPREYILQIKAAAEEGLESSERASASQSVSQRPMPDLQLFASLR
jgi:gamma-glutamylcyclotransferase